MDLMSDCSRKSLISGQTIFSWDTRAQRLDTRPRLRTIRAIHKGLPHLRVVYGGVYPSYADKVVMAECDEIDAIVRGEGEQTILGLIRTWEQTQDLSYVDGVTWRKGDEIIINRSRGRSGSG